MATIQIRNLTAAPVSFSGTSLVIEGLTSTEQLPASTTRTCYSSQYDIWLDSVLRTAVNSNLVEIIIGGLALPKTIALASFDTSFNVGSLKPPRTISATVAPGNEIYGNDTLIYADVTAAGGTQSISLPLITGLQSGTQIEICHYTDGQLTIVPKSGVGQIYNSGTLVNNIISRQKDTIYKFIFDGSYWLVASIYGVNYLHHWRGREYEDRTIISTLLVNGTIDDWDILLTNPNARFLQVASAGVTVITGIVNPNTLLPRKIKINVNAGTVTFANNNVGSTLGYRFSIGANISITSSSYPQAEFTYNNNAGQVWTK